jgi:5-methylcytosine-specific restriction protein A
MANIWIFQANPNKSKIHDELNDPDCNVSDWNVRPYRSDIKKGDTALVWISDKTGKERGIHAIVEIISDLPELRPVPPNALWGKSKESNPKEWMVDYRYISKFKRPILESEIKQLGLSDLSIIKNHRGINFKVKTTEWEILSKEIERRGLEGFRDRVELDISSDIDESEEERFAREGKVTSYYGKRYERKLENRLSAIRIHGLRCSVCGFDFSQAYGARGQGFIEIHHIKPISTFEEEMEVNPKTDLVPVCANCHRMIHRDRDDVMSIEELKKILNLQKPMNG